MKQFESQVEPAKVADFNEMINEGDVAGAVNRVVDPPGMSELCMDIPVPNERPVVLPDDVPVPEARPTQAVPVATGSGVCRHYSKWVAAGVPKAPLQQMLKYYERNQNKFRNQRYLSFADYSQSSSKKRFYLFDMNTGAVTREHVSHGSGYRARNNNGDPNHDGMIDRCSHSDGTRTNMTRVGFFQTANFYFSTSHDRSKKGRKGWPNLSTNKSSARVNGLRMVGLSETNKEALSNGVVMHEAFYNQDAMNGMGVMGRSYGCPAFLPGRGAQVMDKIAGGSLFYGYSGDRCSREMNRGPLAQVSGWAKMCE